MTGSGDAAEQVVRLTLEGVEYSVKIVGGAAKQIAAFLMAAMQSDGKEKQTKINLEGKETLKRFLKSGKETTVFSINDTDLKAFKDEAKRYGLTYCVLKDMDGNAKTVEIMAKAEDAAKISRIMERLEFADVDRASVRSEKVPRKVLRAERRDARKGRRKTNRQANKAYRGEMREARREANKEIRVKRSASRVTRREQSRTAYAQYRKDIGRPLREKKAKPTKERSETAKLFAALIASVISKLPIVKNLVNQDKQAAEATAPPIPEKTEPDDFLPPMEAQRDEGKSKTGQNRAVQPEARSADPPSRAEKSPPSEHGSRSASKPIRATEGYSSRQLSVKSFLTDPKERQTRRRVAEKARERRTGQPARQKQRQNQQKQPQKKAPKKAKKAKER